jgi:hypothetical protein
LVSGITVAFRPPENPTGFSPIVLTKEKGQVISSQTMEQVGKAVIADTMAREKSLLKRWEIGVDNAATDYEDQYWYNPTIHSFGNIGFLGAIHAALAPISTKVIDVVAYDGEDVRSIVSKVWNDGLWCLDSSMFRMLI